MKTTVNECLQTLKYYDVFISNELSKILSRNDLRKRDDYESRFSRADKQNLEKILTYIKRLYDEMYDILREDV